MERDSYFDSLKWVLIVLVIYGHMISNNYYPGGSFSRAIYNTLYTFNMPLFVFLSGRFSQMTDRKRYRTGILRLLETYLLFQLFHSIYWFFQGREFSLMCLIDWVIRPEYIMWYLMSLIFWRLLVYYMGNNILQRHPKAVIVLSFVACIATGLFRHHQPLALQPTLVFMPFFLLGYYSVRIDLKQRVKKVPLWLAIVVVAVVFAVCYFLLNRNLRVLLGNFMYRTPKDVVFRLVYLVVSLLMSVAVMRIVPESKVLAKWGRRTLFIYMWHPFTIFLIYNTLPPSVRCGDVWPVVYTVVVAALLTWLSRFDILNQLLNPVTYVVSRINKQN